MWIIPHRIVTPKVLWIVGEIVFQSIFMFFEKFLLDFHVISDLYMITLPISLHPNSSKVNILHNQIIKIKRLILFSTITGSYSHFYELSTDGRFSNPASNSWSHVTFSSHVFLVSFNLELSLNLSSSFTSLILLKSVGQVFLEMFLNLRLSGIFSRLNSGYSFWVKIPQKWDCVLDSVAQPAVDHHLIAGDVNFNWLRWYRLGFFTVVTIFPVLINR